MGTFGHIHRPSKKITWSLSGAQNQPCVISPSFFVSHWELRFRLFVRAPRKDEAQAEAFATAGSRRRSRVYVEFRRPTASNASASASHASLVLNQAVLTMEWAGGKSTTAVTKTVGSYHPATVTAGATIGIFDPCVGAPQWHTIHSFKCSVHRSIQKVTLLWVGLLTGSNTGKVPHQLAVTAQYTLFRKVSALLVRVIGAVPRVAPFLTGCVDMLTEKVRVNVNLSAHFCLPSSK